MYLLIRPYANKVRYSNLFSIANTFFNLNLVLFVIMDSYILMDTEGGCNVNTYPIGERGGGEVYRKNMEVSSQE
jgi:hypothetical protein